MSDIKVTDSHFTFGQELLPRRLTGNRDGLVWREEDANHQNQLPRSAGQVPATKLKIKEASRRQQLRWYNRGRPAGQHRRFGVFKGSSNTVKDLKEGKLKLIQLAVDNEDRESRANDSPRVIQNLIDYGDDARIVDTLFVAVEASVTKSFEASKPFNLSVNAEVAKVSAEGGVTSSAAARSCSARDRPLPTG